MMNPIFGPASRRDGQAVVEFAAGLVVVLVLFAGLLQVASLSKIHTDTIVEARHRAAEQAMMDSSVPDSSDYIRFWAPGADGKTYTRDDTFSSADPSAFKNTIVDQTVLDPVEWTLVDMATNNMISQMHSACLPGSQFGFVKGTDTRSVTLLPAVRNLIYDAPQIDVQCTVWMTKTRGIY